MAVRNLDKMALHDAEILPPTIRVPHYIELFHEL